MKIVNKVKELFSSEVDAFWIDKNVSTSFTCPNVSLFRLIGGQIGSINNKKVLEVGFGHASDLIECKRRGAKIFGLDLNPKYVENIKNDLLCDVKQFRAGKDYIPYDLSFDLIYSIDTIYYLTDSELKQFFRQCATKLVTNGKFIIQFIETDLKLNSNTNKNHNFDINFLSNYVTHRIHSERNSPIRHLIADEVIAIAEQSNLRLVGSKRMLQSYDLNETEIRVDKYLIFSKQ